MQQSNQPATEIAILLLAAGNSSRLGQPKQLLRFGDKSLLGKTLHEAMQSKASEVAVVLGAHAELMLPALKEANYLQAPILNSDWAKGMGNSLKAGLHHLIMKSPTLQAVIITVCDQPYLTKEVFDDLISTFLGKTPLIVASRYANGATGVPGLFDQSVFKELLTIDDKEGAKTVIQKLPNNTLFIPFDKGDIDMDTPDDVRKMKS